MKLLFANLLALLFNLSRALQQPLALSNAHLRLPTNIAELHKDFGPVPGDSPVRYNSDPSMSLFAIDTLDMHPNPCVMYIGVFPFISSPSWASLPPFQQPHHQHHCQYLTQHPSIPVPYLNHVH